jgi:hypothetical protein
MENTGVAARVSGFDVGGVTQLDDVEDSGYGQKLVIVEDLSLFGGIDV